MIEESYSRRGGVACHRLSTIEIPGKQAVRTSEWRGGNTN